MTDQRAEGAINKIRGKFDAWLGKLTGNRRRQAGGVIRQAQGNVQQGVADLQDSAHRGKGDTEPE